MPLLTKPITAMTFGAGKFVALTNPVLSYAEDQLIFESMISTNGRDWQTHFVDVAPAPEEQGLLYGVNYFSSLVYGNGMFVALAGDFYGTLTSPDGITWTYHLPPSSSEGNGNVRLRYGNGLFVAVNQMRSFVSPDGVSWTDYLDAVPIYQQVLSYGNGTFVAIGDPGTEEGKNVAISTDGILWATHIAPFQGAGVHHLVFGNGVFVATFLNELLGRVAISDDGVTWELIDLPNSDTGTSYDHSIFIADLAFGGGLFVMHEGPRQSAMDRDGRQRTYLSRNGRHWWTVPTPASRGDVYSGYSSDISWRHTTYGNGLFVSAQNTNLFMRSGACVGLADYAEGHYVRVS